MHVLLAVFFLVSSMVKVHGKHPGSHCRCVFDWVACVCANDRLLCLSRGGLHRHSFFCVFLRMQDVARTSNCRTSSVAEAQGRPGQLLPGPIT